MPSQTFLNLPIEKQNSILSAAKKEFSKVEFSKSSINQIVKDARISRGSFYMYFEDKKDLLTLVLTNFIHGIKKSLNENIVRSGGDLTETVLGLFDYFYHTYEVKENQGFVKHMMMFMQSENESSLSPYVEKQPFKQGLFRIIPYLNKDQFAFQKEEDIRAIVDIVFSVLQSVLVTAFIQNQTIEESKAKLTEYLRILQIGYQRK